MAAIVEEKVYKVTKADAHAFLATKILNDTGDAVTVTGIEEDSDSTYYRIVTQ